MVHSAMPSHGPADLQVNSTMLLSAMLMQFTSPVPMPYFSWVEYDLQAAALAFGQSLGHI